MRVLLINIQIGSGSAGAIVSELYHGIISHGDECKIAYSRGEVNDVPEIDTIKIGNRLDVLTHATLTRLLGNTASYSKIATKQFLNKIEEYNPDIVHIHGLYGYYINMEMLFDYLSNRNITVVTTLHSCWDFTGHCCYFDYAGCDQWKKQCHNCPQKKSYPRSSFLDNTKRNITIKAQLYHQLGNVTLVSPSKWMDQLVSESCLGDLNHVVINNGIDTNKFRHQVDDHFVKKLGLDYECPTILSVASLWDRRKGLEDIYELAEYLKNERINIVAVGLSDKQMKTKPNNVIGIKRTNNIEQLVTLYSFATVLFNPTYEDNYPTVNLEAIACGTPVITYDTGGSAETVREYRMGIVINKKNYIGIKTYTVKEFGLKSFNKSDYVVNRLDSARMIAEYIGLYNKCL